MDTRRSNKPESSLTYAAPFRPERGSVIRRLYWRLRQLLIEEPSILQPLLPETRLDLIPGIISSGRLIAGLATAMFNLKSGEAGWWLPIVYTAFALFAFRKVPFKALPGRTLRAIIVIDVGLCLAMDLTLGDRQEAVSYLVVFPALVAAMSLSVIESLATLTIMFTAGCGIVYNRALEDPDLSRTAEETIRCATICLLSLAMVRLRRTGENMKQHIRLLLANLPIDYALMSPDCDLYFVGYAGQVNENEAEWQKPAPWFMKKCFAELTGRALDNRCAYCPNDLFFSKESVSHLSASYDSNQNLQLFGVVSHGFRHPVTGQKLAVASVRVDILKLLDQLELFPGASYAVISIPDMKVRYASKHKRRRSVRDIKIGGACFEEFNLRTCKCPECPVDEVVRSGKREQAVVRAPDPSGHSRSSLLTLKPILGPSGAPTAVFELITDVSVVFGLAELSKGIFESDGSERTLLRACAQHLLKTFKAHDIQFWEYADATREFQLRCVMRWVVGGSGGAPAAQEFECVGEGRVGCVAGRLEDVQFRDALKSGVSRVEFGRQNASGAERRYQLVAGVVGKIPGVRTPWGVVRVARAVSADRLDLRDEAVFTLLDMRAFEIACGLVGAAIDSHRARGLVSLGNAAGNMLHRVKKSCADAWIDVKTIVENVNRCCGEGGDLDIKELTRQLSAAFEPVNETYGIVTGVSSLLSQREPDIRRYDLKPLLLEVVKRFSLNVSSEISVSACDCLVECDREMLVEAMSNLIGNALEDVDDDVSSGGAGNVAVRATREDVDVGPVHIRVTSPGPAIPDRVRERMFEPFYTTKRLGLGLGLPIARKYAEAQYGELRYFRANDANVFDLSLPSRRGVVGGSNE